MAKYYWTEDGIGETVQIESKTFARNRQCYHCGRRIVAGGAATVLTAESGDVYILHRECAERSVEQ